MTVAIQVENRKSGIQTYEERFVLIKANSHEEAYKKIERTSKGYEEPYLNGKAQMVRWKIESLDDCYAISVSDLSDFEKQVGVEVYSTLKSRRLNAERLWDGKG